LICKKCNQVVDGDCFYTIPVEQRFLRNGNPLPEIYSGFNRIPCCKKCGEVIDYKDLPSEKFWTWFTYLDESVSRELKGKALIRYFQLDDLLGIKKDVGD